MSEKIRITLAAARVNAHMTQEEAAKGLKISKRTILNWEKGVVLPSMADMKALADMYNFPVDNISLPRDST